MKKIFLLICAAAALLVSCTKDLENRVGALEQDVQTLQQQITELTEKLNKDVDDLKKLIEALQNNVYVTSVTEIKEDGKVVGYTIALTKGQAITIYHGTNGKDGYNGLDGANGKDGKDGKDAVTPTVGVIVEGGVYYWAVNGVALTDAEGNKIPVYAETDAPEFKYEDGKWWISTDGTWNPLVSAGTGESVFADVQYDDASVTFVLADGTELVLPRQAAFSLNIANTEVVVLPGETVKVAYTITGATETTTVYAVADGGYTVKVEAAGVSGGNLTITAPSPLTDGKVVVFAGNNTQAAMQVLTFEEGALTIEGEKYDVAKEGGNIEIPVLTNLDYEVEISAGWLTFIETKAMRNETLVLNAAANSGAPRKAEVTIKSAGQVWCTFTVAQEGVAVEGGVAVEDLIGNWTVAYISGAGANLSYTMPIEASDDESKGNLILKRWFNQAKAQQDETIYATFDAAAMTLSIVSDQKIKGSYGDPGKAKDKSGNYLDPIVFEVSADGKTLSIDAKVEFGTYYLGQFTSFGNNYSLTKQE